MGRDGNLCYPLGPTGGLQITRMLPSGASSVLAALPATGRGPLPHLNGIAAGSDGSLYYTENDAIRRITAKGEISTVMTVPALVNGPSIPGTGQHPFLRGLALDDRDVMYVADNGDARVLKITPDGKIATLLQSQSPWSPTALAVSGNDLYVLEFLHTARDVRRDWLPRVRKMAADGKETILATVDQMPGARTLAMAPPMGVEELKTTVQGSGECRLEWKASGPARGDNGADAALGAVFHYRVERRTRTSSGQQTEDWGVWKDTSIEPRITLKGLARDVEYDFRIVAVNEVGSSEPSNVVTVVLR